MGYKIHFDEEIIGKDELKLIETKKAILEKLRVFGFEYAQNPRALAATQAALAKALPVKHSPRPR